MSSFLRSEDIIDVEDVIAVLVIIPVVLGTLARLGKNPTRVARGLVLEAGVANPVRCRQVNSQSLQGLQD